MKGTLHSTEDILLLDSEEFQSKCRFNKHDYLAII